MSSLTDTLWTRYRSVGDEETRSLLCDQYIGLVHHAARQLAKHLPPGLELEDLICAGTIGLVQALESFDPERGLAFSTFAVPRIRGAMLDEMRDWDWMPRSVRDRAHQIAVARSEIEQRLGRPAGATEMADALGVDRETFERWLEETGTPTLMPLDAPAKTAEGGEPLLNETIPDPAQVDPMETISRDETLAQIASAMASLPRKDQLVLSLYYYENLTFRQIGTVLHITESRVSQIHSRALRRLREGMAQIGDRP